MADLYNLTLEKTWKSSGLYSFFLALETAIYLSLALNHTLPFSWKKETIQNILLPFSYINTDRWIRTASRFIALLAYPTIVNILITSHLFILFCGVLCGNGGAKIETTGSINSDRFQCRSLVARLLALYLLMMRSSVLSYASLQTLFSVVICFGGKGLNQCYEGYHLVLAVIAWSNLVVHLLLILYTEFLFFESNPFNRTPFGNYLNNQWILEVILKIGLPILSILDHNGEGRAYILIGVSFFLILKLWINMRGTPMFDTWIQKLRICLTTIIISVYLSVALRALIIQNSKKDYKKETNSFVLMLLGLIPITYSVMTLWSRTETSILSRSTKQLKSETEFLRLFDTLIKLIKKRSNIKSFIKLHGYLRLHSADYVRKITNIDPERRDPKHDLSMNRSSTNSEIKDGNPWERILNQAKPKSEELFDLEYEKNEQILYWELIQFLVEEAIKKIPGSVALRLFLAAFLYHNLNGSWKAVYLLKEVENLKPSLRHRMAARRLITTIEGDFRAEEELQKKENYVKTENILDFEKAFTQFMAFVEKATQMNFEMWKELVNKAPDSKKVMVLGKDILVIDKTVRERYEKLEEFNLQTTQILLVYGGYLRDVIHDESNSTEVLEKVQKIMNFNKIHQKMTKTVSEELVGLSKRSHTPCIIQVSADIYNFGEILGVSRSVWRYLGYKPEEIVGENVSFLMPKFIAELHNGFLTGFFEKEDNKILEAQRVVLGMNKKGYLSEMRLEVRVMTQLKDGIRIVGIIRPTKILEINSLSEFPSATLSPKKLYQGTLEKDLLKESKEKEIHVIQYILETGEILGVSESCFKEYGLRSTLFNQKASTESPSIQEIIPGITDLKNQLEFESEEGVSLKIDTRVLERKLYFVQNNQAEEAKLKANFRMIKEGVDSERWNYNGEMRREGYSDLVSSSQKSGTLSVFNEKIDLRELQRLREAQITAWIVRKKCYQQEDPHTVVDLHFTEIVTDPNEGTQARMEESVSLTENQSENNSEDKASSTTSEEDSFDQVRIIKKARETMAQKKNGLIHALAQYYVVVCLSVGLAYFLPFSTELNLFGEIKSHLSSLQAMFERMNLIYKIDYQNQKMELISSSILGKNSRETLFDSSKLRMSRVGQRLATIEKRCITSLFKKREILGKTGHRYLYNFLVRSRDGSDSFLRNLYQDGIFQYLSSTSVLKNSGLNEISRKNKKDQKPAVGVNSGNNELLTLERMHFYRIEYNAINGLRVGSRDIIRDYDSFLEDRIVFFRYIGYAPLFFHIFIITTAPTASVFCIYFIMKNDKDILGFFGLLERHEIEGILEDIEEYSSNHLNYFREATEGLDDGASLDNNLGQFSEKVEEFESEDNNIAMSKSAQDPPKQASFLKYSSILESLKSEKLEEGAAQRVVSKKKNTILKRKPYSGMKKKRAQDQPNSLTNIKEEENRERSYLEDDSKLALNIRGRNLSPGARMIKKIKDANTFSRMCMSQIDESRSQLEDDQRVADRVQLLKSKARSVDTTLIKLVILPLTVVIVAFIATGIFIKTMWANEIFFLDKNIIKLGRFGNNLNLVYNLMYRGLSNSEYPKMEVNGQNFFETRLKLGYQRISELGQDTEFPFGLQRYEKVFNTLMFGSVCGRFIKPVRKGNCDSELLNSSLETISIYILESSRKYLKMLTDGRDGSATKEEISANILNSQELKDLENLIDLINDILKHLTAEYRKSIDNFFKQMILVSNLIFYGLEVIVIVALFLLVYLTPVGLRTEVAKTRGMLRIIPSRVLTTNRHIRKIFVKEKQNTRKKGRRRYKRRGSRVLA